MAIAVRQHTTGDSTSSAASSLQSSALGSSVLTGSNLKLFVLSGHGGGAPTVSSVSDTASNNGWAKDDSATGNGTQDIEVWTCPNATGGSSFKATAHFSGSTNATIWLVEETGEATSSYADGNGSSSSAGTGSTTGPSSGAFTTSNAGIIYTFWTTDSNLSATSPSPPTSPSNFTSLGAVNNGSTLQQGDVAYLITASGQSGIDPQWGNFANNANNWTCIGFGYKAAASASFSASPNTVPSNHNGNITLALTGSGTTWTGGTSFSISGVTGWTKVSQNVTSGTAATLVISGPGILPAASSTGTLTVSDGTLTSNVTVATPTLAVSPTSVSAQQSTALTFTGTNTLYSTDQPHFTTSAGGDSITTSAWTSATAASGTYIAGAVGGTPTITDPSTGATTTLTVTTLPVPSAPTIAISTSAGMDTVSITVVSTPASGGSAVVGYKLYEGSTGGGEGAIAVATLANPTTTVASGSNGAVLPQATINVGSTTGFPASGTIYIVIGGVQTAVTYTGTGATTFTGCSGGSGTLATGQGVYANVTGSFPAQTTAAAGAAKFYVAKAYDAETVPELSPASNEVSSRTTGIVASGVTYQRTFTAGYGSSGAGLTNIGYTIYDPIGAILVPHTTAGVYELPSASGQSDVTGIYTVDLAIDTAWRGTILWDAPAGGAPIYEQFQVAASNVTVVNNTAVKGSGTTSDPWRPAS